MNPNLESGEILRKIRHFCSFQERYIREVRDKLKSWAVQKQNIPAIIRQMQDEGFLSEERFVKAFASGKFRHNKWGRQKIEFELKIRGIPENLVNLGIAEIDGEEYQKTLSEMISRKFNELKAEKIVNIREKIITFAFGKGYEMSLIHDTLKELHI